jgi:hypothetical protein
MYIGKVNIDCPEYQKQEQIMQDVIVEINQAKGAQEKARFAQGMQEEADELLSCKGYDSKKLDCKRCHFIANLRKQFIDLIIRAKKLA